MNPSIENMQHLLFLEFYIANGSKLTPISKLNRTENEAKHILINVNNVLRETDVVGRVKGVLGVYIAF